MIIIMLRTNTNTKKNTNTKFWGQIQIQTQTQIRGKVSDWVCLVHRGYYRGYNQWWISNQQQKYLIVMITGDVRDQQLPELWRLAVELLWGYGWCLSFHIVHKCITAIQKIRMKMEIWKHKTSVRPQLVFATPHCTNKNAEIQMEIQTRKHKVSVRPWLVFVIHSYSHSEGRAGVCHNCPRQVFTQWSNFVILPCFSMFIISTFKGVAWT